MKPVLRYHQLSIMYHLAKMSPQADSRVELSMAEVGVRDGETSARLLKDFPFLTMYLIDNWPKGRKHKALFRQTQHRTSFARNRVIIYRQDSVEAAHNISDSSLDLCFIDADHSYKGVKRDIEAYYPKVKQGGYLGGHDFGHHASPGVKEAVEEFGKLYHLDMGTTWWIQR